MNIKTGLDLYKTKDQFLAALLYGKGHTLEATEWNLGVCYFLFADKEKCQDRVSEYYKGRVKVDAKALFDALNTVKAIIYSK
jgi:hypothetical protein